MKKVLIIALIALTGCTSRYSGQSDDNSSSSSCTVYDSTSGVTIECPDGSKAMVQHGANGSNGLDGGQQSGLSNLSRYLYCDSTLSNTNLSVYYRLATFTTGYSHVVAGVYGTQIEINNSLIYPSSHADYQSSPVYFTYDLAGDANGGYWRIHYNTQTYNVTVDYVDVDSSLTWELTECVLEDF